MAPLKVVLLADDDRNAVALLGQAPGSRYPGAFSIVPVDRTIDPRIQGTSALPTEVAIAPPPSNIAVVTVRDPLGEVRTAYYVRLHDRLIDEFELSSPPLSHGTGIAPTDPRPIAYVAQEHAEGRITFIQPEADGPPAAYVLTGFEIGAEE